MNMIEFQARQTVRLTEFFFPEKYCSCFCSLSIGVTSPLARKVAFDFEFGASTIQGHNWKGHVKAWWNSLWPAKSSFRGETLGEWPYIWGLQHPEGCDNSHGSASELTTVKPFKVAFKKSRWQWQRPMSVCLRSVWKHPVLWWCETKSSLNAPQPKKPRKNLGQINL